MTKFTFSVVVDVLGHVAIQVLQRSDVCGIASGQTGDLRRFVGLVASKFCVRCQRSFSICSIAAR